MGDDARDKDAELPAKDAEIARRDRDFTRRALLRAGWMAPVVTTVSIPSASAQSAPVHNDVHGDVPHQDEIEIHSDLHVDSPLDPLDPHDDHSDDPPHSDHSDAGVHGDSHGDAHEDHDDHTDGHADYDLQGPYRRRARRPSGLYVTTPITSTPAATRIISTTGTGTTSTARSATRIQ